MKHKKCFALFIIMLSLNGCSLKQIEDNNGTNNYEVETFTDNDFFEKQYSVFVGFRNSIIKL